MCKAEADTGDPPRSKWLGRPGPASDPHRPQRTLTLILLAGLLLPWVVAGFEWHRIRANDARIERPQYPWGDWSAWDALALWILALKNHLVLLPVLIVCGLFAWRARTRTGAGLFLFLAMLVVAWAGVDLETFSRTGVHLTYYVQYITAPDAANWMGDVGSTVRDTALRLLPLMGTAAVAVVAAGVVATLAWRGSGRIGSLILLLLVIGHVLMLLLIAPAQALSPPTKRGQLQRLHDMMPYNLVWTAPTVRLIDVDVFQGPLNERLGPVLRRAVPAIFAGPPADTSPTAFPDRAGPRPNVAMIVLDSLRFDAMVPEVMPRLSALARDGLVLRNHHAGARTTHLGLFTLLYGRCGGIYRPTLRAGVPPQACVSFRGGGYQTNYVSGVPHFAWMRMHTFLNEPTFDRMRIVGVQDWPTSDRRALATSRRILAGNEAPMVEGGAPQFLTVFLVSTHYPYVYPEEFATRTPAIDANWTVMSELPAADLPALVNRYHNACAFLDAAVGDFVDSIDRSNTVIVITGDHGESLLDDGFLTHGTRWSGVQSHVPCIVLGPTITPRELTEPTTHEDLLPTLLHLAGGKPVQPRNATGRDLLSPAPPRGMTVTAADSYLQKFQLLAMVGDRRLLLEFPEDPPSVIVRGTVDEKGGVDPYDLPPAAEAEEWARHLGDLLMRMTELGAGGDVSDRDKKTRVPADLAR